MKKIEDAARFNPRRDDTNRNCYHAIRGEIKDIEVKCSYCKQIDSDELRLMGLRYIQSQLKKLIEYNENLLGFSHDVKFTEEEISEQIQGVGVRWYLRCAADEFSEVNYNEEYDVYLDPDGSVIDEDEFADWDECKEMAYNDLYEEYLKKHPNGADVDKQLTVLLFSIQGDIASLCGYLDFINEIGSFNKQNSKCQEVFFELIIGDKKEVFSRLKAIPQLKGKRMGLALKMLEREGIIHPIGDGQFAQVHRDLSGILGNIGDYKAARNYYDDTKYDNSCERDVVSIKSAYYQS